MARTYRRHSEAEREVLRKAGLSMASELYEDEKFRLAEMADEYLSGELDRVSGGAIRSYLIQHATESKNETPTEGESIMAKATKSKPKGRPAKNVVSKQLATKIASMRRNGATWADCDAEAGFHRSSTGWREELDGHGFDKFGRKKGSNQSTKAKAWGSAEVNGNGKAKAKPKAAKKGKKVRRVKATAKK